ncbi:putative F-box protein At1g65770 [Quercus robur]|uniref:putative F-box protein At1g65770 n=1 Tax=Quercus robur TaxID=38942 RepID=UPI002163D4D2|nr:putative F-box protein At1g65770 [Quercus robur]
MMSSVSPLLDYYDHLKQNRGERFCFGLTTVLWVLEYMMRSVSTSFHFFDHFGIRTTTLNRGDRFCVGLITVLLVLDYMAHIPIIKSGLPRFLFVISFILTVLISDISLAERRLMMTLIGLTYLAYEIVPRYEESSLLNRIINYTTPTCRYKNSLSFISLQAMNLFNFTSLIRYISFTERPIFMSMIVSFIFSIDSFPVYMERYLVNRFSIVTLNFGFDSNDWSQLHIDFVSEIVNRLHSFEDFMAATGISRTWRSACFAITIRRPQQLPWLMLFETPHTHRRRFFSLLNKNRYQLPLSKALCGKRCWGSQHNWVVALGPDYRAHLVPLMKGEPITLPPLDTIRGDAPEEWFRLAHKFILFKDPSHDHELYFLVFAIFSPMNCLAFARVGEGAALNRRGQDEWVIVTNPDNLKFKDVACVNDEVYGLCDEGTLVHFELDAPLLPEVQVIASHQPDVREPRKLYLVESMGNLYMVFRYGYLIPSQRRHVTTSFLVYMFNFSALAFEEVGDLEGHAFFVDDGNSWSIPTSMIPGITNRIYFTDDHWDWPMYLGGAYGGCDLGGFNMANRFRQSLPFGKVSPPSYSRPILVTPPIRLD